MWGVYFLPGFFFGFLFLWGFPQGMVILLFGVVFTR